MPRRRNGSLRRPARHAIATSKAPTGIYGFDEVTRGGLPRARATLLQGGPGCGKTVMALQTLVNGARDFNEPGIFVAFEESAERIVANAAAFGWNLPALTKRKLFFLDAQVKPSVVVSGSFDLEGMLATLGKKIKQMGAKRIVFDAIDVVLSLLNDPVLERRELHRLHDWLQDLGLTAIITSKVGAEESNWGKEQPHGFMHFMVDCAVILKHKVVEGISQRNLRVLKYRGSSFEENETPFLIADMGMEVASVSPSAELKAASSKRISSGIERLDAMLGGGFYRGSATLITGQPGSAKSTLCAAFAERTCERGDRVVFVNFDVDASEAVRNLASVNIRLAKHIASDALQMVSMRSLTSSAETQLMRIRTLAHKHRARVVVIDPVSALSKIGNEFAAHGVAERLLDWAKSSGITLMCTSLVSTDAGDGESTPLQVSTLADTWIHLSYVVRAGERNRGLTIIKSRGTKHSNQVRELILSDKGITLSDVYTAGGEVLMGTMRWEKEQAQRDLRDEAAAASRNERARLIGEEAELEARLKALRTELDAKRQERGTLERADDRRITGGVLHRRRLAALRSGDRIN